MNTTKIIILFLPFFGTLLTKGQTLPVFNIDSVPIKCLVDIGGYQQGKFFINGKNQEKLFDKLFLKNRNVDYDISEITVVNEYLKQYLSVGSFLHDGTNWNNVFVVGYVSPKQMLAKDVLTSNAFKTPTGIELGIEYEIVKTIMKTKPSVDISQDSIAMLRYYFYDLKDYRYEFYGMPKYMIAFRFINNRLVKFGFGNFFDFYDPDFSLKEFNYRDEVEDFIKNNYE
jgi:hypothetical protein